MEVAANRQHDAIARLRPVAYSFAREQIQTGDILLCRGTSIEGMLISRVTHAPYTHAAMAGYSGRCLMSAETVQHHDARLISLSSEVKKWPGYYDVFRVRTRDYRPDLAWSFMCHAAGACYSWRHISRTWLRRRLGEWCPAIPNSDDPEVPRDCSALVHAALRYAGGPRLKEFDCDVVPGDLADPRYFEYQFTLCGTQAQAASLADQQAARQQWAMGAEPSSDHVEGGAA